MASSAYSAKRHRRELEPESRPWHDAAVETPWEDAEVVIDGIDRPDLRYGGRPIQAQTTFVMKNVFFFSHMTAVQHKAIPLLRCPHNSVIVEAATGSGKTLAFLTPIVERLVFASHGMVVAKGRPNLTNAISAVVLSPSRVLAEQTAVVAKKLCARYPFNISAILCDEVIEPPKAVVTHLRKARRGAGVILITTPEDLVRLMQYLEVDADADATADEDTEAIGEKRSRDEAGLPSKPAGLSLFGSVDYVPAYMPAVGGKLRGCASKDETKTEGEGSDSLVPAAVEAPPKTVETAPLPFLLVVDEADVVLKAPRMRSQVEGFAESIRRDSGMALDVGLYGATVGSSNDASEFAARFTSAAAPNDATEQVAKKSPKTKATKGKGKEEGAQSTVHSVVLHSTEDFVSLLQNKFLACPVQDYLHSLVHTINLRPNRKHFIFFNSIDVLLFVKGILEQLVVKAEGDGIGRGKHHTVAHNEERRNILYISRIYAMHEQLSEAAKFNEYNGFLSHGTTAGSSHSAAAAGFTVAKLTAHKRDTLVAQEKSKIPHIQSAASKEAKDPEDRKNPHFMGGWKRESRPTPGQGAILLCTDEAAFGLDVRDVDYVYHAELPSTPQSYVHRIGRVGRMGMRGTSVLLLPVEVSATEEPQDSAATWNASGAYRTVKNSKGVSRGQPTSVANAEGGLTEEDFTPEQKEFFDSLNTARALERHRLPSVAPLTPVIRDVVQCDPKLVAAGKKAAMRLSRFGEAKEEGDYAWWTPRMALQGLLLAVAK